MDEGELPGGARSVSVLFSGDLGRQTPIYLRPKDAPPTADFVVCESTYGDKLHHDVEPIEELLAVIREVIDRKAVLVIPAFAVDRAQELIFCINRE